MCLRAGRSRAILRARRAADEMDRGTCRRHRRFVRFIENCSVCSTAFAVSTCKGRAIATCPNLCKSDRLGVADRPDRPRRRAPRRFGPRTVTVARRSRGPIRAAAPCAHIVRYETHSVPGCRVRSGREGGARREPVECGGSRLGPRAWPRPRTTIFYYSSLYCCKSNLSSLATDSTSASAASHRKRGASM